MVQEALSGIVIGNMQPEDLPAVLEIEQASCSMPWSETLFFNEIRNPKSVPRVGKIQGRVAGYLCSSLIIDEGHILNLAVHPDYRGRGIACELIKDMLDCLKGEGCRFIFLEVRSSNEVAKKMYEKFNFRIMGTRKDYYVSPVEDAVIMVLKLEEAGTSSF